MSDTRKKIPISLCMIVKNEEKMLDRCMASASWCDDIIVVDTGSTDGTKAIAKKYTDRVYDASVVPWNFSEARNISIGYAKHDYLLFLDADEELGENAYRILKKVFLGEDGSPASNTANGVNTYFLQLKNIFPDGRSSTLAHPRIFNNTDKKFHYTAAIHNQPSLKPPIAHLDITLSHYGYSTGEVGDKVNEKAVRTAEMLEAELEKDPNSIRDMYHLIKSYNQLERYGESIVLSNRIFEIYYNELSRDEQNQDNYMRMVVELTGYFYFTACLNSNQRDQYMRVVHMAIATFPNCVDVLYNCTFMAMDAGMMDMFHYYSRAFKSTVERHKRKMVEGYWHMVELQHLDDEWILEYYYGQELERNNDFLGAIPHYKRALELNDKADLCAEKVVEMTLRESERQYNDVMGYVKDNAENGDSIIKTVKQKIANYKQPQN